MNSMFQVSSFTFYLSWLTVKVRNSTTNKFASLTFAIIAWLGDGLCTRDKSSLQLRVIVASEIIGVKLPDLSHAFH